eukprot:Skav218730  [mRNA]  locus=scaffold1346:849301:849672:+ [translate_table: standard]
MTSSRGQWTWTRESTGDGTGSFLSKASVHKTELTAFLQALKENPQDFQDWIQKVRKLNFPGKGGGSAGAEGAEGAEHEGNSKNGTLGDFHGPLNEIRASRACATLVRNSVCETKTCWRHMVSL